RFGDGAWKTVGQAGAKVTTFTRNLSAPGTYRYQVAALRAAGSGSDTIQSADPKQIIVSAPKRPEPTTTTTQPPAEAAGDTGTPAGPSDPGATPGPGSAAGPPGSPAAPGAPASAAAGSDTPRGALVSPIQPGAPGSVKSGGVTFGSPIAPQAAKPGQPTPPSTTLDESEG